MKHFLIFSVLLSAILVACKSDDRVPNKYWVIKHQGEVVDTSYGQPKVMTRDKSHTVVVGYKFKYPDNTVDFVETVVIDSMEIIYYRNQRLVYYQVIYQKDIQNCQKQRLGKLD